MPINLLNRLFRFLGGDSQTTARPRPPQVRLCLEPLEDRIQLSGAPGLGAAAQYAVLGLQNTQILDNRVAITGNEGVSRGGKLTDTGHSTITGSAYEYTAGQYHGRGKLGGGLVIDPTQLTQSNSDALNAAAQAAALKPTEKFGTISRPTTVTGDGGLNVIQVNGSILSSLILSGTAADVFVVNVTGSVSLAGRATLGLGGGVTADHVLYNFTGARGSVTTHAGNVIDGTLLAPTYNFNLDGTFNGEIIGGGKSITLLSGAHVNDAAFSGASTSLSGSVFNETAGGGFGGLTVTLSYVNGQGQTVNVTTTTASDGSYSFSGLQSGVYTVSVSTPFLNTSTDQVGTVNGATDGASLSGSSVGSITLASGDAGVGYDFFETHAVVG